MIEKILLDTDPGSDIDDAFCLSYLLSRDDCQLVGVTTVTNDTQQRAAIVDALCQAADKEIPVYAGANQPLCASAIQYKVPQYEYLKDIPHRDSFSNDAVDFMYRTIKDNPHEITLLAVGPLTNVALLFSVYPEAVGLIKQLVIMGGRFEELGDKGEWNIYCDPHAAKIVFEADVKRFLMIGLDVTLKVRMDKEKVLENCNGKLLSIVLQLANAWFARSNKVTFHDPLAATVLFDETMCTFKRGKATVTLDSPRGGTVWQDDPNGPHMYADTVDTEKFWIHYFTTVK